MNQFSCILAVFYFNIESVFAELKTTSSWIHEAIFSDKHSDDELGRGIAEKGRILKSKGMEL